MCEITQNPFSCSEQYAALMLYALNTHVWKCIELSPCFVVIYKSDYLSGFRGGVEMSGGDEGDPVRH